MERYTGILGIIVLLSIAYMLSNNRKAIKPRIVIWGMGLQLLFGIFILKTKLGNSVFSWFDKVIKKLLEFSLKGSEFLFGNLAIKSHYGQHFEGFPNADTWPGFGFQFAFHVLFLMSSFYPMEFHCRSEKIHKIQQIFLLIPLIHFLKDS